MPCAGVLCGACCPRPGCNDGRLRRPRGGGRRLGRRGAEGGDLSHLCRPPGRLRRRTRRPRPRGIAMGVRRCRWWSPVRACSHLDAARVCPRVDRSPVHRTAAALALPLSPAGRAARQALQPRSAHRDASRESQDARWKGARWKSDRDVMTRAFIPRASPRHGEMMR